MSHAPRTRPATVHTGARAESAALRHLERQGLQLIAQNYRCRRGEIDLVMLHDDTLVMVEVRYRANADPVNPQVTVTSTKQRRLLQAASWFLVRQPGFADHALRFDVMALSGRLEAPHIEWFRGAFSTDDVRGL